MPKFVIERKIPGVGKLDKPQMCEASAKSCAALRTMGTSIQWVQSYVTDDKLFCIYIATREELIREHARISGFPADHIYQVRQIIDPVTAES